MCFLKALSDLRKLGRGCQLFTGHQLLLKPLVHTFKGQPFRVGTGLLSHGALGHPHTENCLEGQQRGATRVHRYSNTHIQQEAILTQNTDQPEKKVSMVAFS